MRSLFVTGASGFIGRSLLNKLKLDSWENLYLLSHRRPIPSALHPKFKYICAALDDTASYAACLARCDTVIHLAAATGKAASNRFFEVNVRDTERLVEQCERAGVRNLIFTSTIAVRFPDISHYPYAQSKRQAERVLAQSTLNYCIVRPTIVIGRQGATWRALSKIGRLVIPFVVGPGSNRIQPIYLDDLADCLKSILDEENFSNEIFELGGPETLTFEDLIKRIHFAYYRRQARVVHLPEARLGTLLRLLEPRFAPFLPVSAGQLAAFVNDSTTEPNRIFARHRSRMRTVDQMLNEVEHSA